MQDCSLDFNPSCAVGSGNVHGAMCALHWHKPRPISLNAAD